eukprot:TRINITY_DN9424_c0_g1_i1.p1 TRINITY_DN9424_c0_g1~~TRINITY_DN9424_c0_g1_i1.p1  ORF type:complete len:1072 (+),score=203.75 TRINITY_DN9424_c0_g1_i1:75-3290(+)
MDQQSGWYCDGENCKAKVPRRLMTTETRYRCFDCYNYDLCDDCRMICSGTHTPDHHMLKFGSDSTQIIYPPMTPRSVIHGMVTFRAILRKLREQLQIYLKKIQFIPFEMIKVLKSHRQALLQVLPVPHPVLREYYELCVEVGMNVSLSEDEKKEAEKFVDDNTKFLKQLNAILGFDSTDYHMALNDSLHDQLEKLLRDGNLYSEGEAEFALNSARIAAVRTSLQEQLAIALVACTDLGDTEKGQSLLDFSRAWSITLDPDEEAGFLVSLRTSEATLKAIDILVRLRDEKKLSGKGTYILASAYLRMASLLRNTFYSVLFGMEFSGKLDMQVLYQHDVEAFCALIQLYYRFDEPYEHLFTLIDKSEPSIYQQLWRTKTAASVENDANAKLSLLKDVLSLCAAYLLSSERTSNQQLVTKIIHSTRLEVVILLLQTDVKEAEEYFSQIDLSLLDRYLQLEYRTTAVSLKMARKEVAEDIIESVLEYIEQWELLQKEPLILQHRTLMKATVHAYYDPAKEFADFIFKFLYYGADSLLSFDKYHFVGFLLNVRLNEDPHWAMSQQMVSPLSQISDLLFKGPGDSDKEQKDWNDNFTAHCSVVARQQAENANKRPEMLASKNKKHWTNLIEVLPNDVVVLHTEVVKKDNQERYVGILIAKAWLDTDTPFRVYDIGAANEIDENVTSYRNALGVAILSETKGKPSPNGTKGPTWAPFANIDDIPVLLTRETDEERVESFEKGGFLLRDRIIQPVAEFFPGVSKLVIIPSGNLALIPFAALPPLNLDNHAYLVEEYCLSFLSSIKELFKIYPEKRIKQKGLPLVVHSVAFGEPDVNTNKKVPFCNLNDTQEGEAAAEVLKHHFKGCKVLTGTDAGVHQFLAEASSAPVIHLSTHGYFLPHKEGRYLGSSAPQSERLTEDYVLTSTERAGIALSGANKFIWKETDAVCILAGRHVLSKDLSGTSLLVLSLCLGAHGTVIRRKLIGIAQEFRSAGVKTTIASLWSTSVNHTTQLMPLFYQALLEGKMSKAEALQYAQICIMKQKDQRPHAWASWICEGDPGFFDISNSQKGKTEEKSWFRL